MQPEALASLLAARMGQGVLVAAAAPFAGLSDLLPDERMLVARAVESRQREFATGRVLARRLLARLGCSPGPLLPGEQRVPRWPARVTGSISHTRGLCIVAVAPSAQWSSLGVDVEPAAGLDEPLLDAVLSRREREGLQRLADAGLGDPGLLARWAFSAKECAYKAVFPYVRRVLEFSEMEVELDPAAGTFSARPLARDVALPAGSAPAGVLAGRLLHAGPWLLTGMAVRMATSGSTGPEGGA